MKYAIAILSFIAVALLVVCGIQRGIIKDHEAANKAAALQHVTDSIALDANTRAWRFREARALHTADSAADAAQEAEATVLLTQQWFNDHRKDLPGASGDSLKAIILWRTGRR